jgi:uncharacterized membrane protein (DUF441 family)
VDLANAALVPIIVGIVELAKMAGLPARYAGLAAVALGLALTYLASYVGGRPAEVVLTGLATGLAAAGLYSAVKAAVEPERSDSGGGAP